MRFSFLPLAVLAATWIAPLFATFFPFLLFSIYARQYDAEPSLQDHLASSSSSVFKAATTVSCLTSHWSFVPIICNPLNTVHGHPSFPLEDLSVSQRVYFDRVVSNVPRPRAFADLAVVQRAASFVLQADGEARSLEHYPGREDGISVMHDIDKLSRSLYQSLRLILEHVDIAITRAIAMHDTVISGLSWTDHDDILDLRAPPSRSLQLEGLEWLWSVASDSSTNLIASEVQRAITLTSALVVAFDHLAVTDPGDMPCEALSKQLCQSAHILSHAPARALAIHSRLEDLKRIVTEGILGDSTPVQTAPQVVSSFPPGLTRGILERQRAVLQDELLIVRWVKDKGKAMGHITVG